MNRVHVVGAKGCGKTRLVVDVVAELRLRRLRVGTIKYTPHARVLDRPGTDSYRHRAAGAEPSAVVTPDACALYVRTSRLDVYGGLDSAFARCDVVLVEGDRGAEGPKLELWRSGNEESPMAASDARIEAVVSDGPALVEPLVADTVLIASRVNVSAIADIVLTLVRRWWHS